MKSRSKSLLTATSSPTTRSLTHRVPSSQIVKGSRLEALRDQERLGGLSTVLTDLNSVCTMELRHRKKCLSSLCLKQYCNGFSFCCCPPPRQKNSSVPNSKIEQKGRWLLEPEAFYEITAESNLPAANSALKERHYCVGDLGPFALNCQCLLSLQTKGQCY